MITVHGLNSSEVMKIYLNGKIQASEIKAATQIIEEKLKNHSRIRIYVEIISLMGLQLDSIMETLEKDAKGMDRCERLALVSDLWWLKNWNAFMRKPVNGLKMKTYSFDQMDNAIEWIRN